MYRSEQAPPFRHGKPSHTSFITGENLFRQVRLQFISEGSNAITDTSCSKCIKILHCVNVLTEAMHNNYTNLPHIGVPCTSSYIYKRYLRTWYRIRLRFDMANYRKHPLLQRKQLVNVLLRANRLVSAICFLGNVFLKGAMQ